MVIVDSTVWIDYLAMRDTVQTLWLKRRSGHSIGLTDLTRAVRLLRLGPPETTVSCGLKESPSARRSIV
jgi:hypothetical protein